MIILYLSDVAHVQAERAFAEGVRELGERAVRGEEAAYSLPVVHGEDADSVAV